MRQQSTKGLRYNLPADRLIATAMFLQRQPRPVALQIMPPTADDEFEVARDKLIASRPEMDA